MKVIAALKEAALPVAFSGASAPCRAPGLSDLIHDPVCAQVTKS